MKIGTSAFLYPMFGRPVDISVPGYGPLVRPGPTAVHGKPNIWISEKADCFINTFFIGVLYCVYNERNFVIYEMSES